MRCPFCGEQDTKVIDSRLVAEGDQVRRRRECQACEERFTTFESAELVMPKLVKSDGTREPFNDQKLRSGMLRALEKRPVSVESIEKSVIHIQAKLRATGEREVKSLMVGELVMDELQKLDQVAYVRFASVYRQFQDIDEFRQEIDRISQNDNLVLPEPPTELPGSKASIKRKLKRHSRNKSPSSDTDEKDQQQLTIDDVSE